MITYRTKHTGDEWIKINPKRIEDFVGAIEGWKWDENHSWQLWIDIPTGKICWEEHIGNGWVPAVDTVGYWHAGELTTYNDLDDTNREELLKWAWSEYSDICDNDDAKKHVTERLHNENIDEIETAIGEYLYSAIKIWNDATPEERAELGTPEVEELEYYTSTDTAPTWIKAEGL